MGAIHRMTIPESIFLLEGYRVIRCLKFRKICKPLYAGYITFYMEKGYKNIGVFFAAIALITFIGFYKRYFAPASDFPGLKSIHHYHALALEVLC